MGKSGESKEYNYVLVHGGNMSSDTWNRISQTNDYPPGELLGGKIWDSVIPALESMSHHVFAPTLKDEHISNLTEHIQQINQVIQDNKLNNVILVGHSYGGMIITGVASQHPHKIKHIVYIDAALPDPGESLFDQIKSSGSDPLSFKGLEPAPPYTEKLYYDVENVENLQKTYILCTKSEFAVVTHIAKEKIKLNPNMWNYIELPCSHVPMAEMKEELIQILLDL